MIQSLLSFIYINVFPLGALGVFLAEFIEEIIVPIPSAMVLLVSGFVFLQGDMFSLEFIRSLIFIVAIPAAIGLTLGSVVIYKLVFILEKPFLDRFGKFISVSQGDIDKLNKRMELGKFDELFIVLARIFPLVPSVVLAVFCGLIKMPLRKYIILTFIGAFFRSVLLSIVGFMVSGLYYKYANIISSIENSIFALIIVSIFLFIGYRKFYKKSV